MRLKLILILGGVSQD